MKRCLEIENVQAYLDGDLAPAAEEVFRSHLSSCTECTLEVALYRRVIESIERAATWDPGPEFTDRVLDHVLPERVRRRWARRFGIGYAAAVAATGAALGVLAGQPAARETAVVVATGVCRGLVQGLALALHVLVLVVAGFVNGQGFLQNVGLRVAPFARAMTTLLGHSGIGLPFAVAALACVLLILWMRPREAARNRGVPHVGLLGF